MLVGINPDLSINIFFLTLSGTYALLEYTFVRQKRVCEAALCLIQDQSISFKEK